VGCENPDKKEKSFVPFFVPLQKKKCNADNRLETKSDTGFPRQKAVEQAHKRGRAEP
jgi:hypothetical protein